MTGRLTDEYYKARRQLALFSGLLLAWQLIGIELNSQNPVPYLNVTIKNPGVAPWVLIVLIFYFSVRVVIEWYQSPAERRNEPASKADAALSAAIPVFSLAVFVFQGISQIQVADLFDAWAGITIVLANYASSFLILSRLFKSVRPKADKKRALAKRLALVYFLTGLACTIGVIVIVVVRSNVPRELLVGGKIVELSSAAILIPISLLGGVLGIGLAFLMRFLPPFSRFFRSEQQKTKSGKPKK